MKCIIFGMLLSAICGVSHAGNLVIDNSSKISFIATSARVMDFGIADNAGVGHIFSNGDKQQNHFGFATLKGQADRYGTFDYLLGFNDSHAGDADYDHVVVGVKIASVAPVPEPQTYAMMLAGLGLLGVSVRRRKDDNFD
jgi:hypothetical protein